MSNGQLSLYYSLLSIIARKKQIVKKVPNRHPQNSMFIVFFKGNARENKNSYART